MTLATITLGNITRANPVALAAGALLLIAASPALAQDKIAPSRSYGASTYNSYPDTPHEPPDKNYGMPSFGTSGSVMPQQKTMATQEPPTLGSAPGGGSSPTQPDSDGSLLPPPGTSGSTAPGAMPDDSSPDLDFFPKQSSNSFFPKQSIGLPAQPARSAASGDDDVDTPLFTTPDGATSTDASPSGTGD